MLNLLQTQALDVIKKGKSLFLTGPPGVGKSYTLTKIIDYLNENNITYGLTAMTGCAAVLIKGQTLHSFLGIGLGRDSIDILYNKISNNKKKFNLLLNLVFSSNANTETIILFLSSHTPHLNGTPNLPGIKSILLL